jgi:hypothetical protein
MKGKVAHPPNAWERTVYVYMHGVHQPVYMHGFHQPVYMHGFHQPVHGFHQPVYMHGFHQPVRISTGAFLWVHIIGVTPPLSFFQMTNSRAEVVLQIRSIHVRVYSLPVFTHCLNQQLGSRSDQLLRNLRGWLLQFQCAHVFSLTHAMRSCKCILHACGYHLRTNACSRK